MRIIDLLKKECINLDLKGNTKEEILDELIEIHYKGKNLKDRKQYKEDILKREGISSTGLEEGIAIPHAKSSGVEVAGLALGIKKDGVDFDSLDGEDSNLFFMIAAPEDAKDSHVETLGKLTTLLLDDDFREKLLEANTPDEVLATIEEYDVEKDEVEESVEGRYILAVTACPTGIAHTYMAEDSLKKKASEMRVKIKVETNGSTGVKNRLTKEEIEGASGIIVAADKNVEMDRFDGKSVVIVPVKDGIKRPQELIEEALNKKAPIYVGGGSKEGNESSRGSGVYKHLMSGVSNMLPFVVAGGILIAISFMFGIKASDINDPTYNKFAGFLGEVGGGGAFYLMIPILAGFIGMSIADRPGFMPAMVGGLMAAKGNGGFLGGLIAGFVGGYVVLGLKRVFSRLPRSLEGIVPVLLLPLFGLFITGGLMKGILIPVSSINEGLKVFLNGMSEGNLVILGILLGGMMAVDMGGPVNKAAFTFGIAAIEAGNNFPHAAVMAGGMVPPIAIAIATTIYRNKYNDNEKKAGVTNYIMGACFITEGAIPFAAADPIRVIPFSVLGSAIAGGLAMFFKCQLPAPHGGIFVIPLVTNSWMYLLSIVVGSIVSGLLIGHFKRAK